MKYQLVVSRCSLLLLAALSLAGCMTSREDQLRTEMREAREAQDELREAKIEQQEAAIEAAEAKQDEVDAARRNVERESQDVEQTLTNEPVVDPVVD